MKEDQATIRVHLVSAVEVALTWMQMMANQVCPDVLGAGALLSVSCWSCLEELASWVGLEELVASKASDPKLLFHLTKEITF